MKSFVAFWTFLLLPHLAMADVPCLGGSPDVFKFVKWELKNTAPDNTEITLTVRNTTDTTFTDAKVKIRWGEWHQFFFRFIVPVKANAETSFMNPIGMPPEDAAMLQGITPTLCAASTVDEAGNRKDYK